MTKIVLIKLKYYNTSPEYSILRTLRRDTRRKKDATIESVLSSRLLEHFYIEKYFIRPAFLDRDTILLNLKTKVTPFSLQEKERIHTSLVYLNELFAEMDILSLEAKRYISGLCRDIETLLVTEAFPTVSDDDLIEWVHKKREEEQRKAEARRGGVN